MRVELKLDGFRCLADTTEGRLLSKQKNRMKRFERLLEQLPPGYIFDGEIVCLDEAGKPVFNDLLFCRREPVYIPFDVLNVEGADVRGMALKDRRAILDRIVRRYGMQKSELFFGCGKSFRFASSIWRASSQRGLPMLTSPSGRNGGRF
jgi:ATP-dependent DNA ligase